MSRDSSLMSGSLSLWSQPNFTEETAHSSKVWNRRDFCALWGCSEPHISVSERL